MGDRWLKYVEMISSASAKEVKNMHTQYCVIKEWVSTEGKYVKQLECLDECFFPALTPFKVLIYMYIIYDYSLT